MNVRDVAKACNGKIDCEGFSFSANSVQGDGCFKVHCEEKKDAGFGEGSHSYYEREFIRKHIEKWPRCCNLKCFQDVKFEEAQATCSKNSKCEGFSYTSGETTGRGCYKHKCDEPCKPGFGVGKTGKWDYYAKNDGSNYVSLLQEAPTDPAEYHEADEEMVGEEEDYVYH
jgi:hypothetical protein